MRYRTVLFDLDGTLIDHLPAIHRSYAHTLPQIGLEAPTYEQVKRAIGGGLEHAMRKFVPEDRLAEALRIYRAFWDATMLDGATVMPGGRELLVALQQRGIQAAVFTNKHGPSSRRICQHLGIESLLAGIFGAGDTSWYKPDPRFARHVVETLKANPAETCLVGDSPFDVQAAASGQLAFFGVETGTHTGTELRAAGAQHVFPNLCALSAHWHCE